MHQVGDEIFDGEKTGSVNITRLTEWLNKNREPEFCGMMQSNVSDLLKHHEFDETRKERIKDILSNLSYLEKPLIVTDSEDGGVFIIDGWHRLEILYNYQDTPVIKFMAYRVSRSDCAMFNVPKTAIFSNVRRG